MGPATISSRFSGAGALRVVYAPFVWISLDSLARNETYQWVMREKPRKVFPVAFSAGTAPAIWHAKGRIAHTVSLLRILIFCNRLSFGFRRLTHERSFAERNLGPTASALNHLALGQLAMTAPTRTRPHQSSQLDWRLSYRRVQHLFSVSVRAHLAALHATINKSATAATVTGVILSGVRLRTSCAAPF